MPTSLRSRLHAGASLLAATFVFACQSAPPAPPPTSPSSETPAPTEPGSGSGSGSADAGAALTAAQCTAAGGEVVGDIGDGAIHRPDYRCAKSGAPPLGPIAPDPGGPIAVEGSVCCR